MPNQETPENSNWSCNSALAEIALEDPRISPHEMLPPPISPMVLIVPRCLKVLIHWDYFLQILGNLGEITSSLLENSKQDPTTR